MIDMNALLVGCGLSVVFGFISGIMVMDILYMKRHEKRFEDEVIEPYSAWKKRKKW